MQTREIRILNVPESDLNDIKAMSLALGKSNQSLYREALKFYAENHPELVRAGREIMETQAALRKE